jgi:hypothetical protein
MGPFFLSLSHSSFSSLYWALVILIEREKKNDTSLSLSLSITFAFAPSFYPYTHVPIDGQQYRCEFREVTIVKTIK